MQKAKRTGLAIILAAGEGTRMKSSVPKILHKVAGRSMVGHVIAAARAAGVEKIAVVVGPNRDDVAAEARLLVPEAEIFVQAERLGTAHAVLAAQAAIAQPADDIVILFGDTPLVSAQTVITMRAALAGGASVVGVGFEAKDPAGYGRFIMQDGQLAAIREHKDASEAERKITFCNGGLMALQGGQALTILKAIQNNNAQREYYLTDAAEVARAQGLTVTAIATSEDDVLGVNDRVQLSGAEAIMQRRLREKIMRDGATLIAPDTVYLSHDTKIGRDVLIEPHVYFGENVTVADRAVIHGFSHLEGAIVSEDSHIGPYARLRPGAVIGTAARIGNFVEVKNTVFGAGAKANHLSYIGDATVGAKANIGAGTITCNYDGFNKAKTEIGAGAFIGSNSALVAPVSVAEGAYVGSGSVITKNVPANALAVARGRQEVMEGWADKHRARNSKIKKA